MLIIPLFASFVMGKDLNHGFWVDVGPVFIDKSAISISFYSFIVIMTFFCEVKLKWQSYLWFRGKCFIEATLYAKIWFDKASQCFSIYSELSGSTKQFLLQFSVVRDCSFVPAFFNPENGKLEVWSALVKPWKSICNCWSSSVVLIFFCSLFSDELELYKGSMFYIDTSVWGISLVFTKSSSRGCCGGVLVLYNNNSCIEQQQYFSRAARLLDD